MASRSGGLCSTLSLFAVLPTDLYLKTSILQAQHAMIAVTQFSPDLVLPP